MAGIAVGGAVGVASTLAGTAAAPTPAASVTVTATAAPPPAATVTVTARATAPAVTHTIKVTPAAVAAFGDGVYLVGTDVRPGQYRATGPLDDCYWEIDKSADPAEADSIVANDNVTGGHPTVVLRRGEQFRSERCGGWARS